MLKMLSLLIFSLILQIQTIISIDQTKETSRCDSHFCTNLTRCTYTNKEGGCTCKQGFRGQDCSDYNECSVGTKDPCFHRGLCINTPGSYRCHCLNSWTGFHCDKNLTSKPECLPGYSGFLCNIALCDHGYALNSSGTNKNFTCYCDKGWTHTHIDDPCDKDINECKLDPNICKNGGNCSNTNGSYICNCKKPWEGKNCTYYNSCRLNPCKYQAKCAKTGNDTDRTYKCTCQLGYKGENCTLDVDECSLKTTNKCVHGNCSNTFGSYKCTCEIGWISTICNETLTKTTTNTTETTNDSSLAMKETKDGLPIIVGASVGGVFIAIAVVVGIYLYKRKRARIASEDITGDTGRNEKFNNERISKTERVAPESTTELNAFNSDD